MLDDYVVGAAAAVIVASVVILATLLARYTKMVEEADKSTRLAKDVWDSVNSRFSVVDTRIIDLMAKTEVLSSRMGLSQPAAPVARTAPTQAGAVQTKAATPGEVIRVVTPTVQHAEGTETETKVLRLLAQGPRTSAQIKEEVGRSREHTARLMKTLFDRGLVVRNDRNKPYVYEITDSGRSYVAS
ncbi:MAG: helix-turn-helix domain-containing protein [Thaumarchaeota archaeon]|nr:helix-turn-helix domain-containing protein [Nitrososphaerota archaeon]